MGTCKRPSLESVLILALLAFAPLARGDATTLQWSRANPSSSIPSPRIDAPIAYDSTSRQLFIFGGLDASGDRNDLWVYSVTDQGWTQIDTPGPIPSPRHGHTATFDPIRRRLIVIAGQGAGFFGDAWAYDIRVNAWTQLGGGSKAPNPRYGHSGVYDPKRDRVVISHGFTFAGRFDDTWALDLKSNSWSDISPNGTRPLRRCLHHAVYVPQSDQMLLYGGCSSGFGPCPQGDLWSFDLATNQWTQIFSPVSPAPRQRYGLVFDDIRKRAVLFGGLGGPPLNDTWEYDPSTSAWTQITPGGDAGVPRYRQEAVFASDLGIAFFFGGQTSDYTNDLLLLGPAKSTTPQIATDGIDDVFSGSGGPFAPGEIVAVYGSSLGPAPGISSAFDPAAAALPTGSGGVSVSVNGAQAPLFYVSANQVNIQIPYEVDGQQVGVTVNYNGLASAEQRIQIAATAPRLYPGVFNSDGSLNSTANPASAGSVVTLFATGQGVTIPQSLTGKAATPPYSKPIVPVRVSIAGQDSEILFVGSAPGTAGVLQVNVRIPADVARTAASILLTVGQATSEKAIVVAIQ